LWKRDDYQEKKKKRTREEKLPKIKYDPEGERLSPSPSDRLSYQPFSRVFVVCVSILILIGGLWALLHIAQTRHQLGLDISRLKREQEKLLDINGRLKARLEEMIVLEDLEVIARESLGMRTPQKGQIVELD
jgi:hypothetical protein